MDRDPEASEETTTDAAPVVAPSAAEPPRPSKLWVAGRIVSDPAETAAALERVRRSAVDVGGAPKHVHRPAAPPAAKEDEVLEPDALEQAAGRHLEQLHLKAAIEAFQHAARLDPARPSAHAGLGACFLHLRDHEVALGHYEKALEVQPDFPKALYGAAICLFELGRLDEAAPPARRLAGVPGDDHRARGLYVLGLIERAQGAWDDAIAHLEEGLRAYPSRRRRGRPAWSEVRHRYELALCYREVNEPEKALDHLRRAASHERRPGPIVLDLARLCLELGLYDEAEQGFRVLLKQDPRDRRAHIGLGRVYLAKQDPRAAMRSFSEALAKAGDDVDALSGMAEACRRVGELDRAAGYLEQVNQQYTQPQTELDLRLRTLEAERRRRDAELLRLRKIAALNIPATGIAHELAQPLGEVRRAAQSARRDLEASPNPKLDASLSEIDACAARLEEIIAVLRGAASEEMRADAVVDLADVFERALSLFRSQLAHRRIQVDLGSIAGVRVLGSRAGLQQVLINVIGNARDALAEAEERRVTVSATEDATHVHIEVRDTGCGMSEAVRDRALEPFFTTKPEGGLGLGLSICSNLLRRMDGSLNIKQTVAGGGTTIGITLRRAEQPAQGEAELPPVLPDAPPAP